MSTAPAPIATAPDPLLVGLVVLDSMKRTGRDGALLHDQAAALLQERAELIDALRKLTLHIYSSSEIARAMHHVKSNPPSSPLQRAALVLMRVGK